MISILWWKRPCLSFCSYVQWTAVRPTWGGRKAFKMSPLLEKVSKVLSCEIRAQAKKRWHVTHSKLIKTTFVLLTYLFPFSRKAPAVLPPPPLHAAAVIHVHPRLFGTDATYSAIRTVEKMLLKIIESFLDKVCFSAFSAVVNAPRMRHVKRSISCGIFRIWGVPFGWWIADSPLLRASVSSLIWHRHSRSLCRFPACRCSSGEDQWYWSCSAITCSSAPWEPQGPALPSFKYYMSAIRDWCLHRVPLHL